MLTLLQGSLPLAKLCAMITMQKRGEPSVQTFCVSLTQVPSEREDQEKSKSLESGLIDVTVHYKTQTIQVDLSRITRIPVFRVSDPVQHKPVCTEDG